MDTTTVTTIINMIDTRIEGLKLRIDKAANYDTFLKHTAQVEILTALSNHLDCCLELQLNALENQTSEC